MITEVKERVVRVKGEDDDKIYEFGAVIRDGKIHSLATLGTYRWTSQGVSSYIRFLEEVLEAIEQTN